MESVNIRIGCENYFVITEIFGGIFDAESLNEKGQFFVFIDHLNGFSESIFRFPPEGKYRLIIDIALFFQ